MREETQGDAPPYSPEDEGYAIGVSLFTNKAALDVAASLTPEDFHLPYNRQAIQAIINLTERGEGVTIHSLSLEMKRTADTDSPEDADNPFNYLNAFETKLAYDKEEYRDVRGIPACVARLRELRGYRDMMDSARLVLAGAKQKRPLNELLTIYEETAAKILRSARSGCVTQEEAVRGLNTLYDDLAEGKLKTVPTHYPELNRLLWGGGLWGGDNFVIAGETSTGKTTLALNIFTDCALDGVKGLYFSREMLKELLLIRIHSRLARVPAHLIRPMMDEGGQGIRARLRATMDLIDALPMVWDDKTPDIKSMRRKAKDYVRNEGVGLIVFDYLKLIKYPGFKGSTADRISTVSWEIKDCATELNVPVIPISQLRRFGNDDDKEGREPTLDMLKDSGDVENDADKVGLIWRRKEEAIEGKRGQLLDAWFKLAKQRQGELGRFKLKFAPDIYSFVSLEQLRDAEKGLEGKAL